MHVLVLMPNKSLEKKIVTICILAPLSETPWSNTTVKDEWEPSHFSYNFVFKTSKKLALAK